MTDQRDPMREMRDQKLDRDESPTKIALREIDEEARTVELAFSSEDPYRRWFGDEILGHGKKEVRLDRINDRAPLLLNHDTRQQIGVVESARVDKDGKGRATVRFSESALAQEIFRDVVTGIRELVSVGYRVHQMVLQESGDDGDVYRVTDWEPFEVSIVPIPADLKAGVGRSDDPPDQVDEDQRAAGAIQPSPADSAADDEDTMNDKVKDTDVQPGVDHEAEAAAVRDAELRRMRSLTSLGQQFGQSDLAQQYISDGRSVDEFIAEAAKASQERRQQAPNDIGLTERETRNFSVCRLVMAHAEPQNRSLQEAAAFELEACSAAAQAQMKAGIEKIRGFVLPPEVMRDDFAEGLRRAVRSGIATRQHQAMVRTLTAGTATDGAELVATDLLAASFIDVLRNRMVVMRAGATMLNDLVGNVAIPRKTSGAAGAWISTEGGNAGNSEAQFDQVTLSPKTCAAYTDYSRQLLLQASLDIEALVRLDLSLALALTIDLAALYGSGSSGQPTGIANTTGINNPTDFAAADPTFAEVVQLETEVATDNADMGALAYMTDAAMRGAFKTTEKASSTAQYIWEQGNTVNGYPCWITNQVTDGDVFFANWAELIIGTWGGLDLLTDPYTNSLSGTIRVVAHQSVDVGVRHPVSFAFNNDGA